MTIIKHLKYFDNYLDISKHYVEYDDIDGYSEDGDARHVTGSYHVAGRGHLLHG